MTKPSESSSSSQEVRKTSGGIVVVGSTKKLTTSIAPITIPTTATTAATATASRTSPTVPVKVGQATVIGMPVKPATLHPTNATSTTTTTIYPSTLQHIPTTTTTTTKPTSTKIKTHTSSTNITKKSKTNHKTNVTTTTSTTSRTAASSPTMMNRTTTTTTTTAAASNTSTSTGKAAATGGGENKDTSTTMATMEPLMNQTVISCVHNIFFLLQSYGAVSYEQLNFNLPQKETKYLTDVLELLVESFEMIKYDKEDDVYYVYNGLPRPEFSPLVSSSKKTMASNANKSIVLHVMEQIDQTNTEIDESLERIAELKKAITTSTSDTGEQGVKDLLTKFQSKYPNIIHDPVYATAMKNVHMDIPLPQKESSNSQPQEQRQSSEKTRLKTSSNTTKRKTKVSSSNNPTKKSRLSSTSSHSNSKSPKKQNIKKTPLPTKQNDSNTKIS